MLRTGLRRRSAGFTMVELMVTVSVIAILAALAAPGFRSVVANGRIRAASQSLQNGLALARAEAIRLNTQVEFRMVSTGWEIRNSITGVVLQEASGKEGPAGLVLTVTPEEADRITFNAFGQVVSVNPTDGSSPISDIDIESASGGYRPMRIEVFSGGMSRLCDPSENATGVRACRRS